MFISVNPIIWCPWLNVMLPVLFILWTLVRGKCVPRRRPFPVSSLRLHVQGISWGTLDKMMGLLVPKGRMPFLDRSQEVRGNLKWYPARAQSTEQWCLAAVLACGLGQRESCVALTASRRALCDQVELWRAGPRATLASWRPVAFDGHLGFFAPE